MRVEATIGSAGQLITAEGLDARGQRFTGTVERNLIEGVFEIDRTRYRGEDSPPFPPGSFDPSLRRWLEPELLIESNDPILVKASHDITAGSSTAWEAVTRIAAWIDENLGESLPGGSARQTYDARRGECGSHARLTAALCRASGIPCRVVSGCMYTLLRDGSFGQHAWNEVYMGPPGWIPLDTTLDEVGSVHAGHIRLGEQVTFHPVQMEILGYRTAPADSIGAIPGR
jgi:transglutaminase-like putative cysteine protease